MKYQDLFFKKKNKHSALNKKGAYYILMMVMIFSFVSLPSFAFAADTTPPLLVKAEATSKQIIYLTFDEPIQDPNTSGGIITISGLSVNSFTSENDIRILKVILATDMGTGNVYPTPLNYTATATNIKDLTGNNRDSTATSFNAFTPHGKYSSYPVTAGSSTRLCGMCHSAHGSYATSLLGGETIKKVCFVCHGTVGTSVYKVEQEFIGLPGPVSLSLHKALDSDNPGLDEISCINCHNPHGDRRSGNDIYPKLLKVSYNNNTYYKGNQICFYCHGNIDRGFEGGVYYSVYGGNHINPTDPNNPEASNVTGPVHYDNTNFGAYLNPSSGTEITCMKCHEKHGSQYSGLLDNSMTNREEALCFKSGCHGTTSPAKNVYDNFYGTGKISRHDVSGVTGRGKIECSSCHGPHTVDNTNTGSTRKQSDPDNTKLSIVISNAFCLKCHDGAPPVKTVNSTTVVPYTITFNMNITSGSGWDKSQFANSGHGKSGFSVAACSGCHIYKPHGSTNPSLLMEGANWNIDGAFPASYDGCLGLCHRTFDVGGANMNTGIQTPFNATYKHPTFIINGVHSDTEVWADKNISRHAECMDCHDVHTAFSDATQIGILGKVNGVVINNWSGATWSNWTSTTPDWSLQPLTPGTSEQYQLCLKCHSQYSYNLSTTQDSTGTAPHDSSSSVGYWAGTFKQTDVAKEFNPNNPAYHAVIGASKIPEFVYNSNNYSYGKFVNGWTATSTLKCTDCHGYDTSATRGPHGSPNRFILRAPWNTDSGTASATGKSGTSTHLCFLCHDYNFYTGADQGSETIRSQFSKTGSYNLHNSSGGSHGSAGCVQCHGAVPHGWNKNDSGSGGLSLVTTSDPRPYSDGIGITNINTTDTSPEGWKGHGGAQWSCQKSCH